MYFFINGLTFLTKGLAHKMLELVTEDEQHLKTSSQTVLVSDFLTFLNQPPENH